MTKPSVKICHDYLSINFGQGRVFTIGWRGEKGTNLPYAVFDTLAKFVKNDSNGKDYGERLKALADQIDTVWPEWNVLVPSFAPGERVECKVNGRKGTVVKKARVNYSVRFDGDNFLTGLSPVLIQKSS